MKIEIEVEETASYKLGFKHGLEEGVDMNPYDGEDIEKYCYRRGYDAGVSEYCRQEHPEDEEDALNIYPHDYIS
jgi:hypothetical protein